MGESVPWVRRYRDGDRDDVKQTAARAFYLAHGFELVSVEKATLASHKSVGVGLDQYYFEKGL